MSAVISLKEAVDEIFRSRLELRDSEPFFLIVGAGVSAPSIKTSTKLIEDFIAKYNSDKVRYGLAEVTPPSTDPIDLYSFWFEKAYPQPILRRNILKVEMAGKPPSFAVLRLAHLLTSRRLCSLVVTPNFDDLLYQALFLFGESPILCDHPATVSRIELDNRKDVQLVHVHGTYQFYDLCNLRGEVVERSSQAQLGSMSLFLSQLLNHRSPIVVGYAGWEHDVIMSALQDRLKSRAASYVYWFCYSSAAYEALPTWLKASDDLRFIIPEDAGRRPTPAQHDNDSEPLDLEHDSEVSASRADPAATLSAVEVLDLLNERFEIDEPQITRDPFEYLAERLEPIFKGTKSAARSRLVAAPDNYDFSSVVARLRHAALRESAERQETEQLLEQIRIHLRRSRYDRASNLAATSSDKLLSVAEAGDLAPLRELFHLLAQAVAGAEVAPGSAPIAALVHAGQRLVELSATDDDKLAVVDAFIAQAARFTGTKNYQESIELINQALSFLEGVPDDRFSKRRFDALLGRGTNTLQIDAKSESGFADLDAVIAAPTVEVESHVAAHAFLHKANYKRSRDDVAALATFEAMIKRFKGNLELRTDVVQALQGGARAANRLKRFQKALQFTRLADSMLETARDVRERVALKQISVAKGVALRGLKRVDEALAAFESFVEIGPAERRVASPLPRLNAMMFAAELYIKKKEFGRARDLYLLAITSFGDLQDGHVQMHVAECRRELEALAEGTIPLRE